MLLLCMLHRRLLHMLHQHHNICCSAHVLLGSGAPHAPCRCQRARHAAHLSRLPRRTGAAAAAVGAAPEAEAREPCSWGAAAMLAAAGGPDSTGCEPVPSKSTIAGRQRHEIAISCNQSWGSTSHLLVLALRGHLRYDAHTEYLRVGSNFRATDIHTALLSGPAQTACAA